MEYFRKKNYATKLLFYEISFLKNIEMYMCINMWVLSVIVSPVLLSFKYVRCSRAIKNSEVDFQKTCRGIKYHYSTYVCIRALFGMIIILTINFLN